MRGYAGGEVIVDMLVENKRRYNVPRVFVFINLSTVLCTSADVSLTLTIRNLPEFSCNTYVQLLVILGNLGSDSSRSVSMVQVEIDHCLCQTAAQGSIHPSSDLPEVVHSSEDRDMPT